MKFATLRSREDGGRLTFATHWKIVAAVAIAVLAVVAVVVATVQPSAPSRSRGATAAGPAQPVPPGFVTRDGMELKVDGQPFRFTGYNNYVLFDCGLPNEDIAGTEARDEFFAGLRPGSVVRIALLPGTDLGEFDDVLASAKKYGQRLVVIFSDHHGECGDVEKDDAFYESGFRGDYLTWVREVVPAYRDDPTIAMWELINEPVTDETSTLRAFFDEAGGVVHQLDPNHLVSSGTLQPDTLGGVNAFTDLSASPGIDVVSLHEYDDIPDVSQHLRPALDAAEDVDKPLMVGEWGLYAGPGGTTDDDKTCFTDLQQRADVARAKLTAYMEVPEVAGALYWSYMAPGAARDLEEGCSLSTFDGDPLTQAVHDVPIPLPTS